VTASIFHRFGIELPIFQAPIGSIASPDLAAAVCNAGGVGHLACTWRSPEQLEQMFAATKAQTRKPFGANFVIGFPIEERLARALEHGVPIISFFWGDASAHLARVNASGALAMQVVGSVDEAKRAADAGFEVVVAQGHEAGGHVRGRLGTMTLLPQVVDAISPLPVVAAGGIGDRRGVAASLALGAAGVWVGTRFLAAAEANIHPVYRDLVLTASGDDTLYSELFDVGWPNAPLRTLKNSTVRLWQDAGRPLPSSRPSEGEIIARRGDGSDIPRYHFGSPTRDVEGRVEGMALYAGEVVGLVRKIEPAAAIVSELAEAFLGGWRS
jgi:NAD(P)H-dependent flavin oxidoreductase YrpB (nitropropane dioxygenase family)